jgi:nitrate/nitrite transporter NarK
LFLAPLIGFHNTYFFVGAMILVVTATIVLPMREPAGAPRPPRQGSAVGAIAREIGTFVGDALKAFTGTRAAWVGVFQALLPPGAYALGLALQSNLAVELGLNDTRVGLLNLWSTVMSALGCVAGGWVSDRYGRRRALAIFVFLTTLPTLYLAWVMHQQGWIMPVPTTMANRPVPSPALISVVWIMVVLYSIPQGLYYGTRAALFMDITTKRVAATQFTAYMALQNVVIWYSAIWQGWAVERWGYPRTLLVDSLFGLVGIVLLPFMGPVRESEPAPIGAAVPEAIEP